MLISLICAAYYTDLGHPILTCYATPEEECTFFVKSVSYKTMYFFHFFDIETDDIVKYTTSLNNNAPWDDPSWIIADETLKTTIFRSYYPLSIKIRTKQARYISGRGGNTPSGIVCASGWIVTNRNSIHLTSLLSEFDLQAANSFCIYHINRDVSTTISTKFTDLNLFVKDNTTVPPNPQKLLPIGHQITGDYYPLLLYLSFSTNNHDQSLYYSLSGSGLETNTWAYKDMDIINNPPATPSRTPERTPMKSPMETLKSTPSNTHYSTPSTTPQTTPFKSPLSTPSSSPKATPFDTPYHTPSITPYVTSINTPIITHFPSNQITKLIKPTPDATWDGEWLDPPNQIVRGNDIPEIKDSHPPIQTEYIKTKVPKAQAIAHISTGTVVVVCSILLAIVNIIRSYKRLSISSASLDNISELEFSTSDLEQTQEGFNMSTDDSVFLID